MTDTYKPIVSVESDHIFLKAKIAHGLVEYGQLSSAVDDRFGEAMANDGEVCFVWSRYNLFGFCLGDDHYDAELKKSYSLLCSACEFTAVLPHSSLFYSQLVDCVTSFYCQQEAAPQGGRRKSILLEFMSEDQPAIKGKIAEV